MGTFVIDIAYVSYHDRSRTSSDREADASFLRFPKTEYSSIIDLPDLLLGKKLMNMSRLGDDHES